MFIFAWVKFDIKTYLNTRKEIIFVQKSSGAPPTK